MDVFRTWVAMCSDPREQGHSPSGGAGEVTFWSLRAGPSTSRVGGVCTDLLPSFRLYLDKCSVQCRGALTWQRQIVSKGEADRPQVVPGLPPSPHHSFLYSATNRVHVSSCPDCSWCWGEKYNWSLPSWGVPASGGRETGQLQMVVRATTDYI